MQIRDESLQQLLALPGGKFTALQVKAADAADRVRRVVVMHADGTQTPYEEHETVDYKDGDLIYLIPPADARPFNL